MIPFTHLHVHSQYSILDGAASINALVTKAKDDNMSAIALTDHGAMFGIKDFHSTCQKIGIKPILGCETYVASRSYKDKNDKIDRSGHHLILLAKNKIGYKNLIKLISIAGTDGMYYKPRIDKALLEKHSEGLIISSSCLGGELPQFIMNNDIKSAEETINWFKSVFKDDYYLELQRHPAEMAQQREEVYDNQVNVNKVILRLAKKYDIKVICTNDVHFTNPEDADAHDLLICLNTGKDLDDPMRMRYTKQEWFKTQQEMNELFEDVPEALQNTQEIVDKIEEYELNSKPIMPIYPIPEEFGTEASFREQFSQEDILKEFGKKRYDALGGYEKIIRIKLEVNYLRHLTYQGAEKRYPTPLNEEVTSRLDFELKTIKEMGYPGYFLIVQDFINKAREMGVLVGPGRGSAAGAAVSYCIGITNIDPIQYDLLFERFLNPDRISMPDVDIDFDDDGRQLVLDYVIDKYGKDKVAQICTFGKMATKSAIRDVGRVMKLPLAEADRLAKLVPEAPKMTFPKAYKESPDLKKERDSENPLIAKTLKFAETLEGSVRQTGVHACGVLISRDPLTDHIPLMRDKKLKNEDEDGIKITQYDGNYVEDIGLLKMDFLGLKTLSIIKETLENIEISTGKKIDIDTIPFNDTKTYQLFSDGNTTAVFQFESEGMKKHLRNLKPNRIEDLVAMNALYRPGPMEYIPEYIERKHGRKEVAYDLPMMEKYLKETYGITVFQEQVMLLSRLLANFSRAESDNLRKAMGKKIKAMMDKLEVKFHEGCLNNENFISECKQIGKEPETLIKKIWHDWAAFASYAFNKSHSVCYAYVAYQTGYLKAHYPAEFMAANMSRNLGNITEITKLMKECKRMGLNVLGPDVNESFNKFTANKKGDIRFGMGAIKGVGTGAVKEIVKARNTINSFNNIYDFVENVNLQTVNKKNLEALAMAGAFDTIENHPRSSYFAPVDDKNNDTLIETLIRYGHEFQADKNSMQQSLFDDMMNDSSIKKPSFPIVEEWPSIKYLDFEKEMIGIYLSAHPLDKYQFEIDNFATKGINLSKLKSRMESFFGKEFSIAGMVTDARETTGKTGKPYSTFTLADYSDSYEFFLFGKDYIDFGKYCKKGLYLMVKCKVEKRYKSEAIQIKIKQIEELDALKEQYINSITINLPLQKVSKDIISEIEKMSDPKHGSATLKFNIYDIENNMSVEMFSRNRKIDFSKELENFLANNSDIGYRIN